MFFTGVVAFIDVRSTNENRFEGVALELEKMGATVRIQYLCISNGKPLISNFHV